MSSNSDATSNNKRTSWRHWLGRLFVALIIAMVVLVGVCFFNMWRLPSLQLGGLDTDTTAMVEVDENAAAQRLAGALAIPSISYEEAEQFDGAPFLELHDYLEENFPRTHRELKREIVGDYSLLYHWQGEDESLPPILLMSHIDVVPPEAATEADWQHAPFAGEIADGYIWGRGALDIKDGAVGLLEAIELLLANGFSPRRSVYLALGHDEEIGGPDGNAKIAALLTERGVRFESVLDEGGALLDGIVPNIDSRVAFVGIGEKGHVSVQLIVQQDGGHSSMPPPQTAIGILAAALTRLEEQGMPRRFSPATEAMFAYLGPEMPFFPRLAISNRWLLGSVVMKQFGATASGNAVLCSTTAITIASGGVKENVLPTQARGVINFRTLPGDTSEDVLAHVRSVVNDERVEISLSAPERCWDAPPASPVDNEAFATLHQTIAEVFPDCVVTPGLLVGATDSRHYAPISDAIYRFIPAHMQEEDLHRVHGVDERISLESYAGIVRFFARYIKNAAG